jgi:hypothetical protein
VRLRGTRPLAFLVAATAAAFTGHAAARTLAGAAARTPPAVGAVARQNVDPNAQTAFNSHLQVTEIEYRLILSRGVVKAGPVDLEAIDAGMDPHDLRLRHSGNGPELAAPQLTSGQRWDGVVNLKPGVYRLWCSLPEHAKLGMHATLQVVR